jgi:hypothetical protein
MGTYDALFEDEDDIFGGTPRSKYWDFFNQLSRDIREHEFDKVMDKIAAMEEMLLETIEEEELNKRVKQYIFEHGDAVDARKKSLYMEYAGSLVFTLDS